MVFSKAFFSATLEKAAVAAAGVLAASQLWNPGQLTLKDLAATGIAAGIAFVYTFIYAFGGQQAIAGKSDTVSKK